MGLVLRRLEDDSELLQCVRWGLVPSATKQRGRRCLFLELDRDYLMQKCPGGTALGFSD